MREGRRSGSGKDMASPLNLTGHAGDRVVYRINGNGAVVSLQRLAENYDRGNPLFTPMQDLRCVRVEAISSCLALSPEFSA